jgi:hypothetical protein
MCDVSEVCVKRGDFGDIRDARRAGGREKADRKHREMFGSLKRASKGTLKKTRLARERKGWKGKASR